MYKENSTLEPSDRVLMAGHLAGAISVLLLSIGTIMRLATQLPTAPMFAGSSTNQPQPQKGSGYWER